MAYTEGSVLLLESVPHGNEKRLKNILAVFSMMTERRILFYQKFPFHHQMNRTIVISTLLNHHAPGFINQNF